MQVPAKENLDAARAALKNNPNATIIELPGMNHLLQDARTAAPNQYNDIEETMSPAALKIITDWLTNYAPAPHTPHTCIGHCLASRITRTCRCFCFILGS